MRLKYTFPLSWLKMYTICYAETRFTVSSADKRYTLHVTSFKRIVYWSWSIMITSYSKIKKKNLLQDKALHRRNFQTSNLVMKFWIKIPSMHEFPCQTGQSASHPLCDNEPMMIFCMPLAVNKSDLLLLFLKLNASLGFHDPFWGLDDKNCSSAPLSYMTSTCSWISWRSMEI